MDKRFFYVVKTTNENMFAFRLELHDVENNIHFFFTERSVAADLDANNSVEQYIELNTTTPGGNIESMVDEFAAALTEGDSDHYNEIYDTVMGTVYEGWFEIAQTYDYPPLLNEGDMFITDTDQDDYHQTAQIVENFYTIDYGKGAMPPHKTVVTVSRDDFRKLTGKLAPWYRWY